MDAHEIDLEIMRNHLYCFLSHLRVNLQGAFCPTIRICCAGASARNVPLLKQKMSIPQTDLIL